MKGAGHQPQLEAIGKDLERLTKRHKVTHKKTEEQIDKLITDLSRCLEKMEAAQTQPEGADVGVQLALVTLNQAVKRADPATKVAAEQREYHKILAKFNKTIEKQFPMSITRAYRDIEMDQDLMNGVIAEHLYREGFVETARKFEEEAGVAIDPELKPALQELHTILRAIRQRDLQPAILWAEKHGSVAEAGDKPAHLLFDLRAMEYLHLLKQHKRKEALEYARTYFPAHAHTHMSVIQRLMGCLAFTESGLERSPYASFFTGTAHWHSLETILVREYYGHLGLLADSPLATVVDEGCKVLPKFVKLAEVMEMQGRTQEWLNLSQLIVDDSGHKYHSLFVCPVSKEPCTPENPPMLLLCGHIISHGSLVKLPVRSHTHRFKCPYCPMEQKVGQATRVYF